MIANANAELANAECGMRNGECGMRIGHGVAAGCEAWGSAPPVAQAFALGCAPGFGSAPPGSQAFFRLGSSKLLQLTT